MFHVDTDSIATALSDVQKVLADSQKNSALSFDFQSFKARNHPHQLAAVDGSNHQKRGTNFVLATLRAGYHLFEKGRPLRSSIDPIKMDFLMNNADPAVGFEHKHELYYHRITGEKPRGRLEFDKVTERIRTLLEWEKVHALLDVLGHNDIIIFDGSLISGEISTSHDFFHALVKKAKDKGISLVGFSKDTSLSIESASLPLVLLESSRQHHPNKNWFVEYDGTYFVKFSKERNLIFRVDVVLPNHLSFDELISWIASYGFDPLIFAYPFPMWQIHDSVRISEMERDQCLALFKQTCLTHGIKLHEFDRMFQIYHDQLDQLSFGR